MTTSTILFLVCNWDWRPFDRELVEQGSPVSYGCHVELPAVAIYHCMLAKYS